jgi:hypothetical protein
VQPAVKLGYTPRVILNFRRFEPHAMSRFQRQGHASIDWFEAYYMRVCRNALMQVHLYGGCCIDYDDLMDPYSHAWADALALVTGFRAGDLTHFRDHAMQGKAPASREECALVLSREAADLYQQMRDFANRPILPIGQARRARAAAPHAPNADEHVGG